MDVNRNVKNLFENGDMCGFSKKNFFSFDVGNFSFLEKEKCPLLFGVHTAREIPVYIPNTEVKPGRGDYTAIAGN